MTDEYLERLMKAIDEALKEINMESHDDKPKPTEAKGKSIGCVWRWEKSKQAILSVCDVLENTKAMPAQFGHRTIDMRPELEGVLNDLSKLLCDAITEAFGGPSRWSPDIPKLLFLSPEKALETIEAIERPDYEDWFYNNFGCSFGGNSESI